MKAARPRSPEHRNLPVLRGLLMAALLAGSAALAAAPCPELALGDPVTIDEGPGLSMAVPAGYAVEAKEFAGVMMRVFALPEGVSMMDFGMGRVEAVQIAMSLGLRPVAAQELKSVLIASENKPSLALDDGTRAYRDDMTPTQVRYYAYPEIDGDRYSLDFELNVPAGLEACTAEYEPIAKAIVTSVKLRPRAP